MKRVYFFFFLFLLPVFIFGQTNTDFWFAAPEVTSDHGDQPIWLRLTSFSQPATVTVSEPANMVLFPPINITIPANSTFSIDLSTLKSQVECKPPNVVLNFGLHIHSNVPITAYYEVAHHLNPELFTLKGNNALGTSFFIPSQNKFFNDQGFDPGAYNSFDIVASENNTAVTITPRKPIIGHLVADIPFTVYLNQGNVYSAQAVGQLATDHLMGSIVTSDKPVAITVKDDSDKYPGPTCADLTGDQIVPVNIIGTEYIVVRGYTTTVDDWVFVTATANNTQVSVNGTVAAILNAGYSYSFNMTSTNLCSSVQTDKPVYVWHVTGYGCEVGSSLLPAMDCTGSTQVAFTRTLNFSFQLIILTKAGAQGSFLLNGLPTTLITAAMFSTVPWNTAYVYARINLLSSVLPVGAYILSNTQDIFHMGVIQTYDNSQSGCSYGYFSDFASLNLGPDQTVCAGMPVTLDAGPNRLSYEWFFNGTPIFTGVQTITVTNPGLYSVTVNDHACILTDEFQLGNNPAPSPVITGVLSFCQGASQQLGVAGTYNFYAWSTGATTPTITVTASGTYGVTVTSNNGCTGSNSVVVTVHPIPLVTLAQPASACSNIAPFPLTGGSPTGGAYSGPGVNTITGYFDPASGVGAHLITYTYSDGFGCTGAASKTLTVNLAPAVQLANQASVCISAQPFLLTGGTPTGGVYSGTGVNSSTGMFIPSSGAGPHTITYTFTDANGCTGAASKTLIVYALPVVSLSAQAPVCISVPPFLLTGGSPAGGVYSGVGVVSATGFFYPSSGTGPHNIIYTYTDGNGCTNAAIRSLVVYALPVVQMSGQDGACITSPPFLLTCGTPAGGVYSGPGVNPLTSFFDPSSGVGQHLITYVYTDVNGCSNTATKTLTVYSSPLVQLATLAAVCISVPPFLLTGGTPAGGVYSGLGVNSVTGYFDPSSGLGPHAILYTYTDPSGCTNTASGSLVVNQLPVVQLSAQPSVCLSVPPFLLTGGTPAGGIFSGPGVNSLTGIFDPSSGAGLHTIEYNYTNANGCSDADFKPLTVFPLPVVQLADQNVVCISVPPFLLTGGTPAGGIYSGTGVNSLTGIFDPSSGAGTHTIIYSFTNADGCSDAAAKTLTVNALPVVHLADQVAVCISVPPFPLTGGTPAGGIYSGLGVTSPTGIFDPSSGAGDHLITYTFTDVNGCTSTAIKTLTVYPLPVVLLPDQGAVCKSVPPFPLIGGTPTGGIYSGFGVNSSTGIFDPSSGEGEHLITYTSTDVNGCTSMASKTLTVYPLPVVQLSPQAAVCISVPPFLLTGGAPVGGIYSGIGVNSVTGMFDPASGAGPHLITFIGTDANGCSNSDSKILTVNPLPVVMLAEQATVCIPVPPFLLTGGTPVGGTYSGVGVNSVTGMFDPSSGAGAHLITYTFTDQNTCTGFATSNLTVIRMPLPTGTLSGPNTVCEAEQNIPYALSGTDPLATSFNWEIIPVAAGTISGNNTSPLVSLNTGYIGNMGIRYQPVSNCGGGIFSGFMNVKVNPRPEVDLQTCNDPVTTKGAKPFRLKGGIPPGGIYGIDGTPLPSGILDPSALIVSPPDHIISYTFTNSFNCAVSKTQILKVDNASNFICKTTLTDIRDQNTYPTFELIIGNIQRCWMASNLNYGTFLQDNVVQTNNCKLEKYCPGNVDLKCGESGGLYQWDELMAYLPADDAAEGMQGLCPPEWHVATEAEWAELINYYQGPGLAGWNLLDPNMLNGFHAKTPGILYQNFLRAFLPPGFSATIFWTSSVSSYGDTKIISHGLNDINPSVSKYFSTRSNALPVRCVRD